MPDDGVLDEADTADRLGQRLAELGGVVAFPPTPDLRPAVARRIDQPPPRSAAARLLPWRPTRRAALLVAAGLLVSLAGCVAALLSPAGTTLADRFGVPGIDIVFWDEAPTVTPPPVGTGLRLGHRVDLTEARAAVEFGVRVPGSGPLAEPDEVYVSVPPADGMASFVYRPRRGLPESPQTGVGALLTQFRGEIDRPLAFKGIPPGGRVESVAVGRGTGYWIDGEAHVFLYRDPHGEVRFEEFRLAGNVLLWEEDGLTFRLESGLDQEAAIALAEAVSAADPDSAGTDGG